ncbi:MAG: diaminopimelate epimerase [Methanoregulaceae archaeon]|nr:diaminopimelate epimerase [Methanoregulaceae archaeon]
MEIQFTKLNGNGNDFILIDEYDRLVIPDHMKGEFAASFCDRHFGIGGDGVLFLSRSLQHDLRMRLFQPDQSEAEMCGNGIRCFAKYALDKGYVKDTCTVETLAGPIPVVMKYEEDQFFATIDMPAPKFDRKDIPATGDGEYLENIVGYDVYAVNIGVPHAVVFVPSVDNFEVAGLGKSIRHHQTFPRGANVNFVERVDGETIRIRTFERGVEGETLSCGTGATASAVIAHKLGFVGAEVSVETAGGPLSIHLNAGTKLEGPADTVFRGIIEF